MPKVSLKYIKCLFQDNEMATEYEAETETIIRHRQKLQLAANTFSLKTGTDEFLRIIEFLGCLRLPFPMASQDARMAGLCPSWNSHCVYIRVYVVKRMQTGKCFVEKIAQEADGPSSAPVSLERRTWLQWSSKNKQHSIRWDSILSNKANSAFSFLAA